MDFTQLLALGSVRTNFDAVVAPAGGDFIDIQDADDDLDAGPYTLIVRAGTYAGFTISTNNVFIFLGPGVVVTGAPLLSGDNISLVLGPGCDVQALITASGLNAHVECMNACSLVGVLMSGNLGYLNGGGWDTLSDGGLANHGVHITGPDCIVENIAVQTTPGGGNTLHGLLAAGARPTVRKVKVLDSDDLGFDVTVAGEDALIEGCVLLGADSLGIRINGPRSRIIATWITGVGNDGIRLDATGDNSVVEGCVIQDTAGFDPIQIDTNAENCVVTGNRTDGAINDLSGTSTVADNDETAF